METKKIAPALAGNKPSLMATQPVDTTAALLNAESRILSHLETQPVTPWKNKTKPASSVGSAGKKIGVTLGLAAAALGGYLFFNSNSFNGAPNASVEAQRAAPADTRVAVATALPPSTSAPDVVAPPAAAPIAIAAPGAPQEAAQIITELKEEPAPKRAALPVAAVPSTPAAAAIAAEPMPAKPKAIAINETAPAPVLKTKPPAEKAPTAAVASAAPVKQKTEPTAPAAAIDKDVNLLTALLQHNSASKTGADVPVQASNRTAKSVAAAQSNPLNALDQPARSPAPSNTSNKDTARDVVERQPGETTTALLGRCKALGFLEGQLCRIRICSGQWDSDAACKATLAQTSPQTPSQNAPPVATNAKQP